MNSDGARRVKKIPSGSDTRITTIPSTTRCSGGIDVTSNSTPYRMWLMNDGVLIDYSLNGWAKENEDLIHEHYSRSLYHRRAMPERGQFRRGAGIVLQDRRLRYADKRQEGIRVVAGKTQNR